MHWLFLVTIGILDTAFGTSSVGLISLCLWHLSRLHEILFLTPRVLLFGGLLVGAFGLLACFFLAQSLYYHHLDFDQKSGDQAEPSERISAANHVAARHVTSLLIGGLSAILTLGFLLFASYSSSSLAISGYMRDVWEGSSSSELLRIQEWAGCCGFASPSDRPQEPCRGQRGCQSAMEHVFTSISGMVMVPGVGIMVSEGLLWIAVVVMFGMAKREKRRARLTIRNAHPDGKPKTIFQ